MLPLFAQTTQTLAGKGLNFYLPPEASTQASNIDLLIQIIMGISVLFTLIILGMMLTFAVKYRKRAGHKAAESAGHSTALELTWTIIPTVLVVIIFFFGFRGFLNLIVPPPNTYEIQAKGKMWAWEFTYPNGFVSPELHVPAGVPVRVILTSDDVIHALYVPAFRVQKMNTPGRYNRLWFEAKFVNGDASNGPTADNKPYTESHEVFCNMYCGTNHSEMRTTCVVHRKEDFDGWLAEASDIGKQLAEGKVTPVEHGKAVYLTRGCSQCHSLNGTAGTGPTWQNLYGNQRTFSDGTSAVADENYIRESIMTPDAKIVQGFNPVMPSFRGSLKDADIDSVIAFMKTISTHYNGGDPNPDVISKYKAGRAGANGTGPTGKSNLTPQGAAPTMEQGGMPPGGTPSQQNTIRPQDQPNAAPATGPTDRLPHVR